MRPFTFWLIFPGGGVTSEIFGGPLDSMISTTDPTAGSPVAFNDDVDRFVVCLPGDGGGSRVVVIRRDGGVFGHDVTMTSVNRFTVGNAFAFQGSPVAFNGDDDRFVVTMGHRIIVIRRDGNVWGHEVSGNVVGDPFPFDGSRVAFNGDDDRFVVATDHRIIVIRRDGLVLGHDVSGRSIGDPFPFQGSRVAFNGDLDRFVLFTRSSDRASQPDRIVVIRRDGLQFGHDISDTTISRPGQITWA
jgi:hypothetical protein